MSEWSDALERDLVDLANGYKGLEIGHIAFSALGEIRRLREKVEHLSMLNQDEAQELREYRLRDPFVEDKSPQLIEGARRMQEKCLQQDYPTHSEVGMHWLPSRDELLKRIRALKPEDVL